MSPNSSSISTPSPLAWIEVRSRYSLNTRSDRRYPARAQLLTIGGARGASRAVQIFPALTGVCL
jgi:hypothetical protein